MPTGGGGSRRFTVVGVSSLVVAAEIFLPPGVPFFNAVVAVFFVLDGFDCSSDSLESCVNSSGSTVSKHPSHNITQHHTQAHTLRV